MESIWQRLSWPQVVALGLVIAGVVAVLAVVPTEKIVDLPWEQLVGLASVLVGGGIGAFSDRLVRPRSSTAPASVPPPTDVRERRTESPPPPRREGMAHPETLVWILLYALGAGLALSHVLARHAVLGLLLLGAASLTGCGAGALGAHARAASIAVLALQGADDLAETAALTAVAGCSDEACLREVEHVTEAIDAGIGSAALVVSGYVEAVRLATVGGESPDLLSALVLAVLRLLREWGQLAALFAPLGVELPALPASIGGLGGGS